KRNQGVRDELAKAANELADSRLVEENGRILDRTYLNDFAFSDALEVRDAESGVPLTRSVTVKGETPIKLSADVPNEKVTLEWGQGQKATVSGTLELPTFGNSQKVKLDLIQEQAGFEELEGARY